MGKSYKVLFMNELRRIGGAVSGSDGVDLRTIFGGCAIFRLHFLWNQYSVGRWVIDDSPMRRGLKLEVVISRDCANNRVIDDSPMRRGLKRREFQCCYVCHFRCHR